MPSTTACPPSALPALLQNPSPAAQKQWLRVQAAYEELVERGSDPFTRHYREHQAAEAEAATRRAAQQAAWREAQARQREKARARIESASDELDTNAFRQLVLSQEERPDGQPWLIQVYANDSPYCRALVSTGVANAAGARAARHPAGSCGKMQGCPGRRAARLLQAATRALSPSHAHALLSTCLPASSCRARSGRLRSGSLARC